MEIPFQVTVGFIIAGFVLSAIGGIWVKIVGDRVLKEKHLGSSFSSTLLTAFFTFSHYVECWKVDRRPIALEILGIIMVIGGLLSFFT